MPCFFFLFSVTPPSDVTQINAKKTYYEERHWRQEGGAKKQNFIFGDLGSFKTSAD